jgi:hypothetical protein
LPLCPRFAFWGITHNNIIRHRPRLKRQH